MTHKFMTLQDQAAIDALVNDQHLKPREIARVSEWSEEAVRCVVRVCRKRRADWQAGKLKSFHGGAS